MSKYRILSVDGGGLRGLIAARFLERLNNHQESRNFLKSADLLVGTSTGGIITLGLAAGKTPKEMAELYLDKGAAIFDDSVWDDIRDIGKLIGADYSSKPLRKELDKLFGKLTLGDLNKKVAVTAFDLDNESNNPAERSWKPKIFHNYSGAGTDRKQLVADVALYTSMAPTYFPSADGYVDGGVFANNPSLVGLAQAISESNQVKDRAKIDEIVLLSVGTGLSLNYIKGNTLDWGKAQWVMPLINIMFDGVAGIADYQARQILGNRYHRLNIAFEGDKTIALDDVKKLPLLDEIGRTHANNEIAETARWLKGNWL